jgi:hypothetical protein
MKIKIFFLLISTLLIFSCEKTKYANTGTISGPDYRKCMCCGGYFIEIAGKQYNFQKSELPGNFTFDDKQLPLIVELNFKLKADACASSGISWITIVDVKDTQ